MHDSKYDDLNKIVKLKKLQDSLSPDTNRTSNEGGIKTRCVNCRQDFVSSGLTKLCPQCKFDEEVRYKEIRDYLFDHPKTSSDEICERFGVSRAAIKRYLRDFKLEISDKELGFFLVCSNCHEPINTGKYCARCEAMVGKKTISKVEAGDGTRFRIKG